MKKTIKLGIIAMVAVIVLAMAGCASNYYNLGDASEENPHAQIEVLLGAWGDASGIAYQNPIAINGQKDRRWDKPIFSIAADSGAIVRVTPGTYTFTATFIKDAGSPTMREMPVSVTYDVSAGKGYQCFFTAVTRGILGITGKLVLREYDITEKGQFNNITSKVVAEETFLY